MKHLKIKLVLALLFCSELFALQAQSTLYVKENTNAQTPFALTSIRKLTFSAGNLVVNKSDGSTSTFDLTSLRYLSFNSIATDVKPIENINSNKLTLYPNPVVDYLQIIYETATAGIADFEIIDLQGRTLLHQTLSCQNGTNHAAISVAHLLAGLYLFRMQISNKLEAIKFYKN
jgi:hypothetical protein